MPIDEVAEWDATHDAGGRLIAPLGEEIQVQVKGADTSSDDNSSFAHGGKNEQITIKDTSHV